MCDFESNEYEVILKFFCHFDDQIKGGCIIGHRNIAVIAKMHVICCKYSRNMVLALCRCVFYVEDNKFEQNYHTLFAVIFIINSSWPQHHRKNAYKRA